jgi:hypothetical protein
MSKLTFKSIISFILISLSNLAHSNGTLYYQAERETPLTKEEYVLVQKLIAKYSVDPEIEVYLNTGKGLNWESFSFYEQTDGVEVILQGSTKLPDNVAGAAKKGFIHWTNLLAEIRKIIPGATWKVSLEDRPVKWNKNLNKYEI